jgi:hypothetical protein
LSADAADAPMASTMIAERRTLFMMMLVPPPGRPALAAAAGTRNCCFGSRLAKAAGACGKTHDLSGITGAGKENADPTETEQPRWLRLLFIFR